MTRALLEEKLGALGDTPFVLDGIDVSRLESGLHVPVSELKAVRRCLVEKLQAALVLEATRSRTAASVEWADPSAVASEESGVVGALRRRVRASAGDSEPDSKPALVALCRGEEQLEAAIEAGLPEVELDWMELVGLSRAVGRAREAGLGVTLATLRVQKPGEESFDGRLARLEPDGVLVRHWGGVMHFARLRSEATRLRVHGDFSLNVTNSITANYLLGRGLDTLTAAHDLDETQLLSMLEHVPAARVTVVVHHRIATFHTEHCVYSHLRSNGRD